MHARIVGEAATTRLLRDAREHWNAEHAEDQLPLEFIISFKERRVLLLGRPGAGKSYVIRCSTTLVRMLTKLEDAVVVAAPTGIAGFQARGTTWHSLLSIPAADTAAATACDQVSVIKSAHQQS